VRFWDDTWIRDKPLKIQYPNLYNIAREPHATISKIMATSPLNISFRRALVDNNIRDWLVLVARISHVQLTEGSVLFKWSLTKSGLFTVRSLYQHLIDANPPFQHRKIWKMRIPLKIKIFLWFLQRGVVLTKAIWLGKIGKVARNVSVVTGMRISNTYSFTAPLLKRFDESSSSLQI
jgi:hypothetical protein